MNTCAYCPNPAFRNYQQTPICEKCNEAICFFCSERQKQVVFNDKCTKHIIGVPLKGNRFMEDKAFMSGGPFEFEPD